MKQFKARVRFQFDGIVSMEAENGIEFNEKLKKEFTMKIGKQICHSSYQSQFDAKPTLIIGEINEVE